MPARIVSRIAIVCSLTLGVLPAMAAQRASSNGPGTRGERRERRHYIAVIGEVTVPGVYAAHTKQPMLSELVRQAGRLTSQASGEVRVIRNGRAVLDAHASTGLRIPLQAGDVVIADSNRSQYAHSGTRGAGCAAEATPVQVALVNLIERPVVLTLRPRHADLTTLLELLGQHPNVARFMHVIGGGRTARLRDGSVLVFDRRTVDAKRIPPLPAPIALEKKEQPADVRPVSSQSQGPNRRSEGNDPEGWKVPAPGPRDLRTAPPPEFPKFPSETAPAAPSPDALRTAARSTDGTKPAGDSQTPVPSVAPPPVADNDLIQKADRSELEADDAAGSIDFVTLIITVFAVLGVLSAVGLLVSMARRAMRGSAASKDSPARRRSRLDQLLHKELEIVVEPVTVPPGQSFFGRATGPQRNRVDDGHEAGGLFQPHVEAQAGRDDRRSEIGGRRSDSEFDTDLRPRATVHRTDGPETVAPASQAVAAAGGHRVSSGVHQEELR